MQSARTTAVNQHDDGTAGGLAALFTSPLVWGTLVTVGFYYVIPYLPIQREFVAHLNNPAHPSGYDMKYI